MCVYVWDIYIFFHLFSLLTIFGNFLPRAILPLMLLFPILLPPLIHMAANDVDGEVEGRGGGGFRPPISVRACVLGLMRIL